MDCRSFKTVPTYLITRDKHFAHIKELNIANW